MKFSLRQLSYFIAAAETGSITLASKRANISQPAISTAISHIERELNVQLFLRHHAQGLSLTPAGRTLLRETKQLLKQAEGLYSAAADISHQMRGELSVGWFSTLAPIVMPELVQSFLKAFPDTQVRSEEGHQEGLLTSLREARIELAITYDLEIRDDIDFQPLASLPPYVLLAANHPLARERTLKLSQLASLPLVLLDLPMSREYFLALFMRERLKPNIGWSSIQFEVVRTMVANGMGYSLLNIRPRSDVALDGGRLQRVALAGDPPALRIGIATLKQLKKTRLAEAFEAHCRDLISDKQIPGMAPPGVCAAKIAGGATMSRPTEAVQLEQMQREVMRLVQARDWPNALVQIDRVLKVRSDMPRMQLNRAQCLLAMGRRSEARASADTALSLAVRDAVLLDALGSFYSFAGDQRDALKAFERAVALAPDNPHFIFNRATVQRFLGNLSAAEADYDKVIALRPMDFEAYKNRSDLRTQTVERNHVAELERLVAKGFADWRAEMQIRYSLAKEYEDLGEYAKSFAHLQQGAVKRRANLSYDVAADVATVDWIIEAFPRGPVTEAIAGAPHRTAASQPIPPPAAAIQPVPQPAAAIQPVPIFIVGLPRSGTTLVDRILSSHSKVKPAGELNDFALAMVAAVRRGNPTAQFPRRELVARSAHIDFAALGREYLERAAATVGRCEYFTDKMPLNYLYCGLIRRALPNAKIIHLTRHPVASGYAMYKTLFKDGYPFSYDLREIAQYYAAYRRLMDHWTATMPGAIHTLSYEGLVADQLVESRKLLEFCGLEWEDACADFHRNAAATTTASASQVRQPIYDSSVSQWRHYASELAPLSEALTSAGINL